MVKLFQENQRKKDSQAAETVEIRLLDTYAGWNITQLQKGMH